MSSSRSPPVYVQNRWVSQFFVQVHCNPVKMTFKVQERVIWNFSIWGKYFSALFFYYFPLKFCQICFFVQLAELFNLGEVFLPHLYHICGGWGFLLTSDSFVEEFSLNFCIKIISVWTNLLLFWTFIPHICHIHWMGSRSTWALKSFLFLLQWCRAHQNNSKISTISSSDSMSVSSSSSSFSSSNTSPSQSPPSLSSSTRKIQVSVMVLMLLHVFDENETFGQFRDCWSYR